MDVGGNFTTVALLNQYNLYILNSCPYTHRQVVSIFYQGHFSLQEIGTIQMQSYGA